MRETYFPGSMSGVKTSPWGGGLSGNARLSCLLAEGPTNTPSSGHEGGRVPPTCIRTRAQGANPDPRKLRAADRWETPWTFQKIPFAPLSPPFIVSLHVSVLHVLVVFSA